MGYSAVLSFPVALYPRLGAGLLAGTQLVHTHRPTERFTTCRPLNRVCLCDPLTNNSYSPELPGKSKVARRLCKGHAARPRSQRPTHRLNEAVEPKPRSPGTTSQAGTTSYKVV